MAYDTDLADRIRELLGPLRGVDEKRMFGGLAFLINGNMSVAVSGQGGLMVRRGENQTAIDRLGDPRRRLCAKSSAQVRTTFANPD
jgi:TfoX/Sxy family transcriptional regulator of competence genes